MKLRALVWQAAAVAAAVGLVVLLAAQAAANLQSRGIASGFGYFGRPAGFELAPGLLPYSGRDSAARALAVGVVNTLRVGALGILLATVLGVVVGVARLSRIWVAATAARFYVEALRNTPLLLQLFFWYALSQTLPGPHEALHPLPGVYLCLRGLHLPGLVWHGGGSGGLAIAAPHLATLNFEGGWTVTPEFAALLIGLTTYTAAFIGEIVRGGVLAVDRGQTEAARALGLSRRRVLRLVILPQALPVIVPPVTGQYMSLVKNSSLAVAIGYADLISVTTATLNKTGQAIEAITVASAIFLGLNLVISLAMSRCGAALTPRRLAAAGGGRGTVP